MPTSTVEQYIKTIYQQEERAPRETVPMKRLSEAMAVTPGTATAMVKHLASCGLVRYTPRKGVVLTTEGQKLALTMVRRHRLIETFLERVLQYDWSEVHDDAERLEHAVSDKFIQRIDAYLGFPATDPHGDPIPSADGSITRRNVVALNKCAPGDTVRISRVTNEDPAFLLLMKEQHLVPGTAVVVVDISETAGTVTVRYEDGAAPFTLSIATSTTIMVERGSPETEKL
ncbi:MAG: metal-dependent transcriptional regulator [Alkalispirochaeta sp.]